MEKILFFHVPSFGSSQQHQSCRLKNKEAKGKKKNKAKGKKNKGGQLNSARILCQDEILSVPAYFPQTPPPPLSPLN